jgi:hypothetical protein
MSVRGLMIFILMLGGGLGWVTHEVRSARARRDAVAAIDGARYTVIYDWQWKDGKVVRGRGRPPWPKWLVGAVGIDLLGQPVYVDLAFRVVMSTGRHPRGIADGALMALVGRLERLEHLDLYDNPRLTDADLVHLRGLTRLHDLRLGRGGVRGPGLIHLRALTRLESLRLWRMPLTDADLAPLAGLRSLRRLVIAAPVTAAGLRHLRGLTGLQELSLYSDAITDADLAALRGMTGLRKLHINSSHVSARGIEAIRVSLPKLAEVTHGG